MKDFRLFDIADFVMDEDFIRWVRAQQPADDLFWENWLKRNPHKHLIVAEARRILESIGFEQEAVAPAIIEAEISQVLTAIHNETTLPFSTGASPEKTRSVSLRWRWAAAAIIVFLTLGAGTLFISKKSMQEPKKFNYAAITNARHLVEKVNSSTTFITVPLPDGSSIKLASNSRISYESKMDSLGTRDVYLSGQAFFSVKKNPERPFRVFANELMAKVLGTTFTIKSFENDTDIQVTVNTGKVSVYSQGQTTIREAGVPNNKMDGIIVTPNQLLVYEKSNREFRKILLENPEMIVPTAINKRAFYEDAPIDRAFDNLSHDYGITVLYDADLMKNCTVTADLSNESFYRKLDLICRAIGARYEVIDGQVVIQSNGCQP